MTGDAGPASSDDPLVGRILSERYRIERKLGEGGMGSVYMAEHVVIQKRVALKVLAPELARKDELAARFLQEARAASRIGQENVIDISDFGRTDGQVYFVMEYLEGMDLGAALRVAGALSWGRTRRIMLQILRALRAAHALNIIHRDLKPENVFLIEREGRPDFVKLLDFGIAKMPGEPGDGPDSGPRLTRTGMIFGTPDYMAPEQAEGKVADHRADLYSAGCVLYHCLTGTPPFSAASFMALLTKHLLEPVEPPSKRRPDLGIPPELDALIARSLEKDRDNRWGSTDEFSAAFSRVPGPAHALADHGGPDEYPGASGTIAGHVVIDRPGSGSALRLPSPPGRTAVLPVPSGANPAIPTAESVADAPAGNGRRLALLGVALGIAAAVAFALLRRNPPPPVEKSIAAPAMPADPAPPAAEPEPAQVPAVPPVNTHAARVTAEGGATAAAEPGPETRSGSKRREARRTGHRSAESPAIEPTQAQPAANKPPSPAVPSELKPFPGQP
jgi:serine/threonine protein kinase